ncbi:MAG: right-handed parallel beta-helix repeat-containing protein, partial [Nitrospirota bacterium]
SPPSATNLSKALVEVAIRSDIFEITRGENVVVRGITFQHDTTGMSTPGGAVHFIHSNNILIEDCQITWNNWFGLRFTQVKNVTTRRNSANFNGGAGWVGWKIKNLLSEEDETSYNNWRGVRGDFLGWEIAGLKHLAVHDAIYKKYKGIGNHTRGFWLDYDNQRIQIEEACICKNLMAGINLEASQGPISIKNSRICKNQDFGISSDSSRVSLEGNHIYGNSSSQVKHTLGNDRLVNNWETGEKLKIHGDKTSLRWNVIATDSNAVLLELSGGGALLADVVLEGNIWHKTNGKDLFRLGRKSMNAPEWQAVTSQSQKSSYSDPIKLGINLNEKSCR